MNTRAEFAGVTFDSLRKMKAKGGEKIACLTAYDATFARVLDTAGVDVVLVGDTLGMVIQGKETTVPVSVSDMVYHCGCVARGVQRALVLCDMPFMSYSSVDQTLENAARLMQAGGAHGVKLEAGEHQVEILRELAACGIPCCAHLGLRPQWVYKSGGYQVQAKSATDAQQLLKEAKLLEEAGADLLLIECVPARVAEQVRDAVDIPVIGIGAGAGCDGQVLVLYDVLGISKAPPRFAKDFLRGQSSVASAVQAYVKAVKSGEFPTDLHTYF